MGPVVKRGIPVRQFSATRQIPPPGSLTAKTALPRTIQLTAPAPVLREKQDVTQHAVEVSDNMRDLAGSLDFSHRIGSKVYVGGAKTGTLLFYGKASFSDGIWCGVCLDEASGKNDGSVNGIRYFTCPPAHGVFVRSNKIQFLPSFDAGQESSIRTLPKVSEEASGTKMAPTRRLPVSSSLNRPSGTVLSGRIQKLGSARKKLSMKQRALLKTDLNATTMIPCKQALISSVKRLAGGTKNYPLPLSKISEDSSKLQDQHLRLVTDDKNPPVLSNTCIKLSSSTNSTIKNNLNSTIVKPCSNFDNGDRIASLASEHSKMLSVQEERTHDVIGLSFSQVSNPEAPHSAILNGTFDVANTDVVPNSKTLSVQEERNSDVIGVSFCQVSNPVEFEAPHSAVLNGTFDVANADVFPDTMPCISQELFMDLSPSKASSPLHLQSKYPSDISFLSGTLELSDGPNRLSDGKVLRCSIENVSLLECNGENVWQKIQSTPSPVSCANETVVIDKYPTKNHCLNGTFQVNEHMPQADSLMVNMLDEVPKSKRFLSDPECEALWRTNTKWTTVMLPRIEENEKSENNIPFGYEDTMEETTFNEQLLPVLINDTFTTKKDTSYLCTTAISDTESTLVHTHSTIAIEPKASCFNATKSLTATNSAVNLNETFDCITKAEMAPGSDKPTKDGQNLQQPDKSPLLVDNCNEFALEFESGLPQESPVSSTPSCISKKGKFFSTLCTPIHNSENWIYSAACLDRSPKLPSESTGPNASQVSSLEESLGILTKSQMQDFTLECSSSFSLVGSESPLSPSFCNRMFPINDTRKEKDGHCSSLNLCSSPVCPQRGSVKKCKKSLDGRRCAATNSFENFEEDRVLSQSSRYMLMKASTIPVHQYAPRIGKENTVPIRDDKFHSSEQINSTFDFKNDNKTVTAVPQANLDNLVDKPSAKYSDCKLNDSLLDLSTCAAIKLPDDSLLDLDCTSNYDDSLI